MSKHRKMKSRTKKFAAVTATTATAAALTSWRRYRQPDNPVTWGDILLTAGPNYHTADRGLVLSSLDNVLAAIQNNVGSAANSVWNPTRIS